MASFRTLRVLCLVVGLLSSISFGYSGGSGTAADPYQIADANDLLALAGTTADYDKCFILTADIDMEGQVFTTAIIAADTVAGGSFDGTAFTGTFDGNGQKITNFTINGGNNFYLGLFGQINSSASLVKNLSIENFAVSGEAWVGGLVGSIYYGSISNCYSTGGVSGGFAGGLAGESVSCTITNCYSTGTISGDWVGGLVGSIYYSSISNCYSTGTVSGTYRVGGLVGSIYGNYGGSISNCYSTGTVSGGSGSQSVGGLVGYNSESSISNCYSTGTVSGTLFVGGLVGENDWGNISNCYSTGTVSGGSDSGAIGGLVGENDYGNISNCYSTGPVSGSDCVGGLVGYKNHGNVSNCYSTGSVGGTTNTGGLVGANSGSVSVSSSFWDTQTSGQPTSAGGEGKTTAEMKTLSTFTSAGWDLVEIWGIGENQTYPYLRTEPAGDLNHDKKVDFEDFAIFAANWLEGS